MSVALDLEDQGALKRHKGQLDDAAGISAPNGAKLVIQLLRETLAFSGLMYLAPLKIDDVVRG